MATIPDRAYNAACGRLASALGVSLAAARRRVDIKAAQGGLRDTAAKLLLAEELLTEAEANREDNQALLSSLLEAVSGEENFMTED